MTNHDCTPAHTFDVQCVLGVCSKYNGLTSPALLAAEEDGRNLLEFLWFYRA